MKHRWFLLFCIAVIGLTGCGGLQKPSLTVDRETAEYQRLLAALVHRNPSLETFKGIGQADLRRDQKEYFVRLAWAGAEPDKLRIEMIGAPGQPKMGFSTDGQWVYYLDPEDVKDPVKKISSQNSGLKRFLSIPVTATDIVSFLSGRMPDYEPHRIRFREHEGDWGDVMVLEKQWWQGVRQEIFLDAEKTEIRKIESYKAENLIYRIEFPKMQTVKGYRVPSILIVSDDDGNFFKLRIDRYWANAELSPELFVLKAPDK
jgi:hypothetical protein